MCRAIPEWPLPERLVDFRQHVIHVVRWRISVPSVSTTQIITHSAYALYQIVLDIEKYPEFVPFCRRTRVLASRESAQSHTILCEMEVAFGFLRESYTSEIIAQPERKTIRIRSDRSE